MVDKAIIRAENDYYSSKLSDVCRTLSLAMLAGAWTALITNKNFDIFFFGYLVIIMFSTISLTFDFLHYFFGLFHIRPHAEQLSKKTDSIEYKKNLLYELKQFFAIWKYRL